MSSYKGHVLHVDRLNSLQQWYYFGRLWEFLYRRNHFSFSSLLQVSITDQFAQVHGHHTVLSQDLFDHLSKPLQIKC